MHARLEATEQELRGHVERAAGFDSKLDRLIDGQDRLSSDVHALAKGHAELQHAHDMRQARVGFEAEAAVKHELRTGEYRRAVIGVGATILGALVLALLKLYGAT